MIYMAQTAEQVHSDPPLGQSSHQLYDIPNITAMNNGIKLAKIYTGQQTQQIWKCADKYK